MSPKTLLSAGLLAGVLGAAGAAEAQVSRVFVSVNGNDANNCASQSTPCRTISGGITQVDAEGEVIILDSGSYAGGAITKAVKVNTAPGVVAFSGLSFTINPGAGKTVVLRGITIKAVTPGSGFGISHTSGNLVVENCVIDGWFNGINSNAGSGGRLSIDNSTFRNNFNGSSPNDGKSIALLAGTGSVSNVHVSNTDGIGIRVLGGTLTLSNSVIVQNGTGLLQASSGVLVSMLNNVVEGNTTNTSGTITSGTLK